MASNSTIRETGTVNHYNNIKGFGFIRREKGRDVFFFYEDFVGGNADIVIGDTVSFEIENKPKGPRACNIQVIHTST
ncbi:retron Se72 family effector protein [Halomonas sp. MCCC 1A11062]|uniref:retron Se72 family effector protein n=1 Tax=Halomonas sp. MCCC 1A11062 TaxID=2733485 RepID=UPI001F204724|nr:retron Se72 family effector protein [Halomonas sp. MCCC 1A11062]MCE8039284.1 cold-shock protein [Halomonas sp. MCCC 1A11062]